MVKRILFFICFFSIFSNSFAQNEKGTGPKEKSVQSERKGRKADSCLLYTSDAADE